MVPMGPKSAILDSFPLASTHNCAPIDAPLLFCFILPYALDLLANLQSACAFVLHDIKKHFSFESYDTSNIL